MSILDYVNPIKAVTNGVVKVKESIWGSKKEQDQQAHDKFITGQQVFSAEFTAQRQNRNWWDSFWDGINRMPRPVIVIAIFLYFGLAYFDQVEFQKLNIALDTVPEKMWWIMTSIVSFYFVAREFQKGRDKKMALSDEEFNKV
ncbi:MAG: holin family protein, partial [Gammaproteobacteria bacterium]|nr:holin family protein [Gammaproteobacteria bacterium]